MEIQTNVPDDTTEPLTSGACADVIGAGIDAHVTAAQTGAEFGRCFVKQLLLRGLITEQTAAAALIAVG